MSRSFKDVVVGDVLEVQFMGSKELGNETHLLTNIIVKDIDVVTKKITTDVTEFYFVNNRWRYGSSAEVARLVSVCRS